MTANGIYQMVARRGRQCGVGAYPHRFRHHFSHTWLYRGGAEGDLMERLRELRRQRALSQAELAKLAGVSPYIVYKLERHQARSCRGRTLARLAAALDQEPIAIVATVGQRSTEIVGLVL